MSRLSLVLFAAVFAGSRPCNAQTDASVGFGVGTVRYPGGSSLGIVSVGPVLQQTSAPHVLTLGGVIAALPHGDWYAQARSALWIASPTIGTRWRLAADVALSGATGGDAGSASGSGLLVAEALWFTPDWGLALGGGPTSGWIAGALPVTSTHLRLRGWWQDMQGRLLVTGSVEPTRLLGAWFTDLGAGILTRRGSLEARLWASARVSAVYGSKGAALGSAEVRLSPRVSLEASGGNVLPDPYQGFPRSAFIMAGVRLQLGSRAPGSMAPRNGLFSVTRRSDGVVIRLRPGAHTTVAIAGDWNSWTATPLTKVGPNVWEISLSLQPGTYHYTVLIDGQAWTIPGGVPSVPDGMGSQVAVLTVF
ncbi:MAG TPA: glycogen-binding domain-containing protein [Gemmatimonadales bacterium]|nr:glycogen-binding domain-containing protein [Gemmatimonadales bacterium]